MLAFGDKDTYGRVIGWDDDFGTGDEAVSGFCLDVIWGEAIPIIDELPVLEAQTTAVGRISFTSIMERNCAISSARSPSPCRISATA